SSVAVDALAWMELMAMKSGLRPRDEKLVETRWHEKLKQAHDLEKANNVYDAYQIYLELTSSFKDLRDVAGADSRLNQLRNSREVRDAIREEQQQIRRQKELEGQIISLIAANERVKLQDDGASSDRNAQSNDEGLDAKTRLQRILTELRRQSKVEQD